MLVPGLIGQGSMQPYVNQQNTNGFTQKVRILVTLRKTYGGTEEYKKMMLIIASTEKIYSLKRAIEREFLDLFQLSLIINLKILIWLKSLSLSVLSKFALKRSLGIRKVKLLRDAVWSWLASTSWIPLRA